MVTPELVQGAHLQIHVGSFRGRVVLDFGTPISHLEMEPEELDRILELLAKHAQEARVSRALETIGRSRENE
jgi:hypothetical protein